MRTCFAITYDEIIYGMTFDDGVLELTLDDVTIEYDTTKSKNNVDVTEWGYTTTFTLNTTTKNELEFSYDIYWETVECVILKDQLSKNWFDQDSTYDNIFELDQYDIMDILYEIEYFYSTQPSNQETDYWY